GKKAEIAAEIPDPRRTRTQNQIAHRRVVRLSLRGERAQQSLDPPRLLKHRRRKARAAPEVEIAPEDPFLDVEAEFEFGKPQRGKGGRHIWRGRVGASRWQLDDRLRRGGHCQT